MTEYCISVGRDPRGDGYLAIISIGHPNHGDDNVIVCDLVRCKTVKEGQKWAARQLADPEWHKRADLANKQIQLEGERDL